MSTDNPYSSDQDVPTDPDELLPEDSILTLEEYLDMQKTAAEPTRYRILYRLVHTGEMSPSELKEVMNIHDSTLHYHLKKLLEVGLIEKCQRTERDQEGFRTYYRATVFGEVTITEAIDGLMRGEYEFDTMYNSSGGEV